MNQLQHLLAPAAAALTLLACVTGPAHAAVPSNDRPARARVATGVGYTNTVDASEATSGALDPRDCSNNASVWYRFTPAAAATINVNTSGSNYDTVLGVYTGRPGAFTRVACRDDEYTAQAALDLKVTAGTTYYFMVGRCCGNGRDGQSFRGPLQLQFNMRTPLRIDQLTVADTGTVDPVSGDARVTVTGRCNKASTGWMYGALRQRVNEVYVAKGFTERSAVCGTSATHTTLTLEPEGDISFVEGPAALTAQLNVCSRETGTCTSRSVTETVTLAAP